MVDGDFQAFQGVWRMQRLGEGCCLSYALFVRPQVWLPVRLIQVVACGGFLEAVWHAFVCMTQGRIRGEVATNLSAVREYAESVHNAASTLSEAD